MVFLPAVPLAIEGAEALALLVSAASVYAAAKFQDVYDSWTDREIQTGLDDLKENSTAIQEKVQTQRTAYDDAVENYTAEDQVPAVSDVVVPDQVNNISTPSSVVPVARSGLIATIKELTDARAAADGALSLQMDDLVKQHANTNEMIKSQNEILKEKNKAIEVSNKINYELVNRLTRLTSVLEAKNELYSAFESAKVQTMVQGNSLAKDIRQGNSDAQINQAVQAAAQNVMAENAVKQKEIAVKRLETQVTDSMGNTKAAIDHELEMYAERRADLAEVNKITMTDAMVDALKSVESVEVEEDGITQIVNILQGLIFDPVAFQDLKNIMDKHYTDDMEGV